MTVMVLDSGNSIIKAKIPRRERGEIAFPHALKPSTEAEYMSQGEFVAVNAINPTSIRD